MNRERGYSEAGGGGVCGLGWRAMNVAHVWPDSGEKFPAANCAGEGGMTMRCLHAGH
jgi:hypothetical protein